MASCSSTASERICHPVIYQIQEALVNQERSRLPELFHECMNEYREGRVLRKDYARAVKLLGKDSYSGAIYNRVILGISPIIGGSPERPPSPGFLDTLYSMFWESKKKISEHVFTYDHPWKVQKYTLVLQELQNNLLKIDIDPEAFLVRCPLPMTEVQEAVYELVSTIFNRRPIYATDRERYQANNVNGVISQIRTILELPDIMAKKLDTSDFAVNTLIKIVQFRYTGIHLFEWKKQLVKKFIVEGRRVFFQWYRLDEREVEREDSLTLPLEWQYKAIEYAPKWLKARPIDLEINKLKAHIGVDYDPGGRNNVPFVAYRWGTLINIRMGTPTIQPAKNITFIAPEFAFFVRTLGAKQKKMLYINLQINFDKGAEKCRTNQLKILQSCYPKEFLLAIFDMDSPFYYQKINVDEEIPMNKFLGDFYIHLTNQRGPYELLDTTSEIILTLFSRITSCLFPDHQSLKLDERRIYIDFFHALLALTLIQNNPINYFTIVCKDGLDRAGILNAILRELINILEGVEKDRDYQLINTIGVHAPPIMTKKIAMLEDRRIRFLNLLELIHEPEVEGRLRTMLQEHYKPMGAIRVVSKHHQNLANPIP